MFRYFTQHPTAPNLLMVLVLLAGTMVATTIPREEMPSSTADSVEIRTVFQGATPQEIEESICTPIEEALETVPNIKSIRTECLESVGVVTVERAGQGDLAGFTMEVESAVAAITGLPTLSEDPRVSPLNDEDAVLSVLVGGFSDAADLHGYSEELARQLRRLPDVSSVHLEGFADRQLRVELDPSQLRRYELTASDVADAVVAESLDLPAGRFITRESEMALRLTERCRTANELEELVIREGSGGQIRLGEIAVIRDVFESPEDRLEVDGLRAARLVVHKSKPADALSVAREVRSFLKVERNRVPKTVQLWTTDDNTSGFTNQLRVVVTNGWQGMVLVFLALWLFFSVRLAFWVVMALPISFLGALTLFPAFGMTLNFVSLVGLLMSIGLLMDDGIVIAENVSAKRAEGLDGVTAAIEGTRDVMPGIVSSFATTLCVLGPLAFLDGDIGSVLGAIPIAVGLVLTVSLVEAFLILPAHLSGALPGRRVDRGPFLQSFERLFSALTERVVVPAARTAMGYRYAFVGIAVAFLVVSVGLLASGHIGFQAFPQAEGNRLEARVMLAAGTRLERTHEAALEILRALHASESELQPHQLDGQKLIELVSVRFNQNADVAESGSHLATVSVDFLATESRSVRLDEFKRAWLRHAGNITDALSFGVFEPTDGPAGRAIEVRILGDDLDRLDRASQEMTVWFRQFDGVLNLSDDLRKDKEQLRLKLRPGARSFGLTSTDVISQVADAFQGRVVDELHVRPNGHELDVRLQEREHSLEDLAAFRLKLPSQHDVPLGSLVEIRADRGWSRIARNHGQRAVTVSGDIDTSTTNTALLFDAFDREFAPAFEARFPDLRLDLEGESHEGNVAMASMLRGMVLGILAIYVLLSLQFRSYLEPLIVMAIIPLSLIGVLFGHFVMSYPFTMPSMFGVIALSGVIVNDSILLVQFTKDAVRKGGTAGEASATAVGRRFRAILLTSVTTVLGLLPLLAEPSTAAQLLKGLVISLVFGISAATILVLLVVPALYGILDDIRPQARGGSTGAGGAESAG